MKPLIVLIVTFAITLPVYKIIKGKWELRFSARTGMSVMLLFTAIGHFMFPKGMALMIPEFIPFKIELIYFTAVIEICAALTLHIEKLRVTSAWLLILFFICILPANIKSAIDHLNFQNASYDGPGPDYLWFRIPLQILFIYWVYFSSIKSFNYKQV